MPSRLYNDNLLNRCLADARSTIKIAVSNGGLLTSIGMESIVENSFYIDRYVTNDTFIYFGTACASECGMTLIPGGNLSTQNLKSARLTITLNVAGYVDDDNQLIDIPMGVFNVYEIKDANGRMNVTCLDDMIKLNKTADYTFFTGGKQTPSIIGKIVTACGVTSSGQLPSRTYNIPQKVMDRLKQNNYTYRDWLIWICEMTSCNAYFDEQGKLRFSRFANTKPSDGYFTITSAMRIQDTSDYQYSLKGVGEIVFEHDYADLFAFPNDDSGQYSVRFEGNEFFKATPYTSASSIIGDIQDDYTQLTPVRQLYNPFSTTTISLPFLMPMDVVMYEPKGGIAFYSLISHTRWVLNGTMLIECKGDGDTNGDTYTQSGASTTSSYYISKGEVAGWTIQGNKASYESGDNKAEINLANIGTENSVITISDGTDSVSISGDGVLSAFTINCDSLTADSTLSGNNVSATNTLSGKNVNCTNLLTINKVSGIDGSSTAPNPNALVPLLIDITTGKIYREE